MKILVAIDQSPFADNVLQAAFKLARCAGGELSVLSVAPLVSGLGYEIASPDLDKLYLQGAQDAVNRAEATAKEQGMTVKTHVEAGASPADSIIRYAAKNNADLIVVGYKGRSAIEKFLLGSVADKVVSHAPCSVHVVR